MPLFFFASDLHGSIERYRKLFAAIRQERPVAVLLGGDLLPHALISRDVRGGFQGDFISEFLAAELQALKAYLKRSFPSIVVILGNDDPRVEEAAVLELAAKGLCQYGHKRRVAIGDHEVCGYSHGPPTPFMLKDWERYDVSRYVDPGCVSPEDGRRTVPISRQEARFRTIRDDLEQLVGQSEMDKMIFLFHAPPYDTLLDRAALDGQFVDHVALDVHVGSIAIRRFVQTHQPRITLHGHVHESARLTGEWRDRIDQTHLFSAAHDGPELALVRFTPQNPATATRELL